MADDPTCPDCGSDLPPGPPGGLCPRCLLRAGLGGDSEPSRRRAGATVASTAGRASWTTLAATVGPMPRVLLRDTDAGTEPGPLVRPASPEMPDPADRAGRLQLLGEIARGGMGAVLKGRDPDLGRDLAVKVLLETPPRQPRAGPPVRRGGPDRRPAPAPRRSCRSTSWAPSPTAGRSSP